MRGLRELQGNALRRPQARLKQGLKLTTIRARDAFLKGQPNQSGQGLREA